MAEVNWIVVAALLPFAAFVAFLLSYLAVALVRAVLSVPAKLDALHGPLLLWILILAIDVATGRRMKGREGNQRPIAPTASTRRVLAASAAFGSV